MEMLERLVRVVQLSTMMIAASTMAPMEVVVDSTVQEKNVTYPLYTKQYRKIIMLEAC